MANRYLEGTTRKDQVLAFVRSRPSCTTTDLSAALGFSLNDCGVILVRLQHAGLVQSEKQKGTRTLAWCAVGEDDDKDLVPRQIVTQSWSAEHVGMWIDFALAAPARQLQGEIA